MTDETEDQKRIERTVVHSPALPAEREPLGPRTTEGKPGPPPDDLDELKK